MKLKSNTLSFNSDCIFKYKITHILFFISKIIFIFVKTPHPIQYCFELIILTIKLYIMKTMNRILFLLFFTALLSCQHENVLENTPTDAQIPEKDIELIRQAGLDVSTIIDKGDYYLVEGDIMFFKEDLKPDNSIELRQGYLQASRLLSLEVAKNIEVAMNPSITNVHRQAIREAMNAWNNISNCCVKFIEIPYKDFRLGTDKFIHVNYNDNMDETGQTTLPTYHKPPPAILVKSQIHPNEMRSVMVHEFGHALGLKHTHSNLASNDNYGIRIPGTPQIDEASVMSYNHNDDIFPGFSTYDLIAIRYLYPGELPKVTDISGLQRPNVGEYAHYRAVLDYMPNELNFKASEITYNWTVPSGASYEQGANGEIRIRFSRYGVFYLKCQVTTKYGNTREFQKKIEIM